MHVAGVLGLLALLAGPGCAGAATPVLVQFPSLDEAATVLDGHLVRPDGDGRHPALVLLHGCGGLLTRTGTIESRQSDWAHRLAALGYGVLMVDSFGPRHQGEMCSPGGYRSAVYLARPKDAYGALRYLQEQPFVQGDRIGLLGWSEGGGALLLAIRAASLGRPPGLASPDFRAAVAFYPASCRESAHTEPWTSAIPLLVLIGAADNWTPAAPCEQLLTGARSRGSPVEWQIYPGAYHDFDWPNLRRRELEAYRTRSGVVPITGMDPAARADALERVPAFLGRYLQD
jgi:dienelactone hydrolase